MRSKEAILNPEAEESQRMPKTSSLPNQEPFAPGAVIRGTLLARRRREVQQKDGKTRYIIGLTVLAKQGVFIVDRWSDVPMPVDLPVVGQQVELPVRISAYVQAGVPKVRIAFDDGQSEGNF